MIGAALIAAFALAAGVGLAAVARRTRHDPERLGARIDMLLPQTQCAQCGYPGCRPYALAIAAGAADIDRCPPGGERTIAALARLLGREPIPLDTSRGMHKPRAVARIDEATCIGCTLCLDACPVDAIVGAAKLMHTVVDAECTGCELCIPPCPVDCIAMEPVIDDSAPLRWRRPTVIAAPVAARR
jgi:Na+-translocating ferredoxin:NAD+ oxidoreductase subunit B